MVILSSGKMDESSTLENVNGDFSWESEMFLGIRKAALRFLKWKADNPGKKTLLYLFFLGEALNQIVPLILHAKQPPLLFFGIICILPNFIFLTTIAWIFRGLRPECFIKENKKAFHAIAECFMCVLALSAMMSILYLATLLLTPIPFSWTGNSVGFFIVIRFLIIVAFFTDPNSFRKKWAKYFSDHGFFGKALILFSWILVLGSLVTLQVLFRFANRKEDDLAEGKINCTSSDFSLTYKESKTVFSTMAFSLFFHIILGIFLSFVPMLWKNGKKNCGFYRDCFSTFCGYTLLYCACHLGLFLCLKLWQLPSAYLGLSCFLSFSLVSQIALVIGYFLIAVHLPFILIGLLASTLLVVWLFLKIIGRCFVDIKGFCKIIKLKEVRIREHQLALKEGRELPEHKEGKAQELTS